MTKSATLLLAVLVATANLSAETLNLTGASGSAGIGGGTPGAHGGNGSSGESLTRSATNALDAAQAITLRAGAGGSGGSGAGAANTQGGGGGNGGSGGHAAGTAAVTLDTLEQELSITLFAGSGGGGGNAGVGSSLSFGGGGDGRAGGDASANARLTAGPSTTRQTASLTASGGVGGNGGGGVLMDLAQTGGSAGLAGRGGEASGAAVMRGSAATVRQTLTANIGGGGSGRNGSGAGVPQSVNPAASHPLNGELAFDMETPADNAVVNVNVSVLGGAGAGRPGVVGGGPLPSKAHLRASRIVASGTNASIGFSGGVAGGGTYAWEAPSGPGVVLPGNLSSGGRGAEPMIDGVELTAGVNGTISGSLSLQGGDGGGVTSAPFRAGKGADVVTKPGILRATSAGGPINLQLQAFSGGGGVSGAGVDGVGGQVTVVNGLNAESPTGAVILSQGASGGLRGGRAVSLLEHVGTTRGFLGVATRATGGGGATFSTLGTAQATTIVTSIGNQTEIEATATGRSSSEALKGADAGATALASGPGRVISTAVATGADAVVDGLASAFSRAEVTSPGTAALAKARTGGARGQSEAVAVALGDAVLPVSRVTARFKGEGIASGGQDGGTGAAAMAVNNFTADAGLAINGNSGVRANAFDAADFTQRNIAVTQPFLVNPAVAAFFTNVPDAKHLVSCRAVQRPASIVFTSGRVVRQTFSGTLELATNRSGGQLVLSGLGFTTQGGGFDSMRFTFRQNGAVLIEQTFATAAEAGAFFTNQVMTLADLSQADSHTVFSWEIITEASTSAQFVEANFLLSATASSGLVETLPGVPPLPGGPRFSSFSLGAPSSPSSDPADIAPKTISGLIVSPMPFATVILESSTDLGLPDSWRPMSVFTTDAAGEVSFDSLPVLINSEVPQAFFRLKLP